jgi:hypothetical protein
MTHLVACGYFLNGESFQDAVSREKLARSLLDISPGVFREDIVAPGYPVKPEYNSHSSRQANQDAPTLIQHQSCICLQRAGP